MRYGLNNLRKSESLRQALATTGLALFALAAVVSVLQGFHNAITNSKDMQWSPTVLLSNHINPYAVAISGNTNQDIIMSQFPPYLHILYILFLPMSSFSFSIAKVIWAIINFTLSVFTVYFIASVYKLNLIRVVLLVGLFFSSTAFRNAIGNGQTSLLCLFALMFVWRSECERPYQSGFALSVLAAKYSFAPPFLFWMLFRKFWRRLIACGFFLVLGWLAFSWLCQTNPLVTALQPLTVANIYALEGRGGGGDVMSLMQDFHLDHALWGQLRLSAIAGVLVAGLCVVELRRRSPTLSSQSILSSLCAISLLSTRHLAYDYIFLAPVAASTFVMRGVRRATAFALIVFFWIGLKILDNIGVNPPLEQVLSFFGLALLFALTITDELQPSRNSTSVGNVIPRL